MTDLVDRTAQARKSTAVVGGALLALAAWNLYRGRQTLAIGLGAAGVALLLTAAVSGKASLKFFSLWMGLASVLGFVNSRVLLSLMFYLVLTPYGLLMRALGRDQLERRGPPKDSYWTSRPNTRQTAQRFERMF